MAILVGFSWIISLQCFILILSYKCINAQQKSPKVSAIYVFGDSAVDTGNNNYLPTLLKGNYRPYGMNFPGHIPTGRFSDGKLVPDILSSMLGLGETVPPFLKPDLSDDQLRRGVCFASAGARLDNQTLPKLTGQINMLEQTEYFAAYIKRLTNVVGEKEACRIVGESLVMISTGNVDFIHNYYGGLPSTRSLQYSVTQYQDLLLGHMQVLIQKLYDMGCRNMGISGLIPLGCSPILMTINSPLRRTCIEKMNYDAEIYNKKLVKLLAQMQAKLAGAKLLYADLYTPLIDLIKNPKQHGFIESSRGCCGTGLIEYGHLCNPLTPTCKYPRQYVFFDASHPSESACYYIAHFLANQTFPQIL